jgi:hypothetical protein
VLCNDFALRCPEIEVDCFVTRNFQTLIWFVNLKTEPQHEYESNESLHTETTLRAAVGTHSHQRGHNVLHMVDATLYVLWTKYRDYDVTSCILLVTSVLVRGDTRKSKSRNSWLPLYDPIMRHLIGPNTYGLLAGWRYAVWNRHRINIWAASSVHEAGLYVPVKVHGVVSRTIVILILLKNHLGGWGCFSCSLNVYRAIHCVIFP